MKRGIAGALLLTFAGCLPFEANFDHPMEGVIGALFGMDTSTIIFSGPAPTNFRVEAGASETVVTWDSDTTSGETYNLYWKRGESGVSNIDPAFQKITPPYIHQSLNSDTEY